MRDEDCDVEDVVDEREEEEEEEDEEEDEVEDGAAGGLPEAKEDECVRFDSSTLCFSFSFSSFTFIVSFDFSSLLISFVFSLLLSLSADLIVEAAEGAAVGRGAGEGLDTTLLFLTLTLIS